MKKTPITFSYDKWFEVTCSPTSKGTKFELKNNQYKILEINTEFPFRKELLKLIWESDNSLLSALREILPLYWTPKSSIFFDIFYRNLGVNLREQNERLSLELNEILSSSWLDMGKENDQVWFDILNSLFYKTREWYYSYKEDNKKVLKIHIDNGTPFVLENIYFRHPKRFNNQKIPLYLQFEEFKRKSNENNILHNKLFWINAWFFIDALINSDWLFNLIERLNVTHICVIPNSSNRDLSFNSILKNKIIDLVHNQYEKQIKVIMPKHNWNTIPQKSLMNSWERIENARFTFDFTGLEKYIWNWTNNVLIIDDTIQTAATANRIARELSKINSNGSSKYFALWVFGDTQFDF